MDNHIVIINGAGGVGKDTLIKYFKSLVTDGHVRNISTVDKIKKAAIKLGWDPNSKSNNDRKALAELKALSDKYWDSSFLYTKRKIDKYMSRSEGNIIFIHCREPENIKRFVLSESIDVDVKTVLISRPDMENGVGGYGNPADDNVYNYDYDMTYIINNTDKDKVGRDFAVALMELLDEDPNTLCTKPIFISGLNICGVKFYDDDNHYGLGSSFTINECAIRYKYCSSPLYTDGSHWFRTNKVLITLDDGITTFIPFNPEWKVHDSNGRMLSDYYNAEPW